MNLKVTHTIEFRDGREPEVVPGSGEWILRVTAEMLTLFHMVQIPSSSEPDKMRNSWRCETMWPLDTIKAVRRNQEFV